MALHGPGQMPRERRMRHGRAQDVQGRGAAGGTMKAEITKGNSILLGSIPDGSTSTFMRGVTAWSENGLAAVYISNYRVVSTARMVKDFLKELENGKEEAG